MRLGSIDSRASTVWTGRRGLVTNVEKVVTHSFANDQAFAGRLSRTLGLHRASSFLGHYSRYGQSRTLSPSGELLTRLRALVPTRCGQRNMSHSSGVLPPVVLPLRNAKAPLGETPPVVFETVSVPSAATV